MTFNTPRAKSEQVFEEQLFKILTNRAKHYGERHINTLNLPDRSARCTAILLSLANLTFHVCTVVSNTRMLSGDGDAEEEERRTTAYFKNRIKWENLPPD